LSERSRANRLILGLQVNIDKANSRSYDVDGMPSKDLQSTHQSAVYIVGSQIQVQMSTAELS